MLQLLRENQNLLQRCLKTLRPEKFAVSRETRGFSLNFQQSGFTALSLAQPYPVSSGNDLLLPSAAWEVHALLQSLIIQKFSANPQIKV